MKNKADKKEKVLVTGANGFVGSYIAEALAESCYSIIGLTRGKEDNINELKKNKNFKAIKCDITNFEEVNKIFKKYKPIGVFHVAALLPRALKTSLFSFFSVNVGGTFNVLEACRLYNIKKVVYSSSMSVYGQNIDNLPVGEKHPVRPYDFYSLTKLLGEEICNFYSKKYNMNVVVLRYAGVYGARRLDGAVANFVKLAAEDMPLKILNNISWDIIFAEDIAKANIRAFKKAEKLKFEIINIGSGKELNIKDLAEKIIKYSGSKSKIKINKKFRDLPPSHFYFDISKAKKILKFEPQDFDKAIEKYIKDIKNNTQK